MTVVQSVASLLGTGALLAFASDLVGGWASIRFRGRSLSKPRSLDGKVIVVTGGNAGIGRGTVTALASMGATVVLCCRSLQRGQSVKADLPSAYKIDVMELDLASLRSIQSFATEFRKRYSQLDVLILNGGLAKTFTGSDGFKTTPHGFEEMVGVNYLAHFYLTLLLLPILRSTPSCRVIGQTSIAASNAYPRGIDIKTWRSRAPDFRDWAQYGQSKLAILLFMKQLQRKEPSVLCLSCHPGVVDGTSLMHHVSTTLLEWLYSLFLFKLLAMRECDGCNNTVYLASTQDTLQPGGFYCPGGTHVPWPRSWLGNAIQMLGALRPPQAFQSDYPSLWDDSLMALRDAGAVGLEDFVEKSK